MKIVAVGGGPAALYFSLLAKKRHPDWQIEIYERNPANVTWGFGVVFSDETMDGFRDADEETLRKIALLGYKYSPVSDTVRNGVAMAVEPEVVVVKAMTAK